MLKIKRNVLNFLRFSAQSFIFDTIAVMLWELNFTAILLSYRAIPLSAKRQSLDSICKGTDPTLKKNRTRIRLYSEARTGSDLFSDYDMKLYQYLIKKKLEKNQNTQNILHKLFPINNKRGGFRWLLVLEICELDLSLTPFYVSFLWRCLGIILSLCLFIWFMQEIIRAFPI